MQPRQGQVVRIGKIQDALESGDGFGEAKAGANLSAACSGGQSPSPTLLTYCEVACYGEVIRLSARATNRVNGARAEQVGLAGHDQTRVCAKTDRLAGALELRDGADRPVGGRKQTACSR